MRLLIDHRYDDLDALRQSVNGWDLDFRLIGGSGLAARIRELASPDFCIGYARIQSKIHQMGSTPAGFRTFGIPANTCGDFWWRGFQVSNQHLLIFPDSNELDSATHANFEIYSFSVKQSELERFASGLDLNPLPSRAQVLQPDRATMRELRQAARLTLFSPSPDQRHLAAKTLAKRLAFAASIAEERSAPRPRQRDMAIRRVVAFLHDAPKSQLAMTQLCEVARVSERTLQYAFNERYAMSPYTFAKRWRLNSARQALLESERSDHCVAEIALRHGFENPSLFTSSYKRLFSELPSETLARCRAPE